MFFNVLQLLGHVPRRHCLKAILRTTTKHPDMVDTDFHADTCDSARKARQDDEQRCANKCLFVMDVPHASAPNAKLFVRSLLFTKRRPFFYLVMLY